uniref:von Willebrand factor A domain-containing protein 1 n=1 Tax=Latimeria chalumnae TaxID=7897 RepID=H3BIR5_LATCH
FVTHLSPFCVFFPMFAPGTEEFVPDCEGDVLFLTDSSGSVSYYEFSKVKEFVGKLMKPFTFGPNDVQTSVVHISTNPVMEFPFNQHTSSATLQQAIRGMQQIMGDTNTGKALRYAKDMVFTDRAGSRANVPKVLVWVTDGMSTDDISQPMQLLKDMGVTVFIVSTGRGNLLELTAAASQPPESHVHFVDVDDFSIITKELRDAIIEVIRAERLKAVDITSTSFRLQWPRLLSQDTEHYRVEYNPVNSPGRKQMRIVKGDATEVLVSPLTPGTTYDVTLIPETNLRPIKSQSVRVTTLTEPPPEPQQQQHRGRLISESKPESFRVTWLPTPDSVLEYQVLYGVLPSGAARSVSVSGTQNNTVLSNLVPNTTYLVTVSAVYKSGKEKALSAKACTQEVNSKVRNLRLKEISPDSLKASWDSAEGNVLGYRVRRRRQVGPSLAISVAPEVQNVLLTHLPPGTVNKICVKAVYKSMMGKALCRTARSQPASSPRGYQLNNTTCGKGQNCFKKRIL